MKKFNLIFWGLMFVGLFGFSQINLTQGLISYYPFNGNTLDESGNTNSGIVHVATINSDRFGSSNNSYFFNGQELTYINCGNISSFNIINGSLTISVWIKPENGGAWGGLSGLISKQSSMTSNIYGTYELSLEYNVPKFTITYVNGNPWYVQCVAQETLNYSKWYHLVAVANFASKQLELYINGRLSNTIPWVGTYYGGQQDLIIGCSYKSNFGSQYMYNFYGNIDDVRLYNRALNLSEIQLLYGNYEVQMLQKQVSKLQFSNDSIKNNCCKATKALTIPLDNNGALLYQNAPNPFSQNTVIKYFVPYESKQSFLYVYDLKGTQLRSYNLNKGDCNVTIYGNELIAGVYLYSLVVDGRMVDTKQMILTD